MIRTLAIILLALSTAGSGFFGWKQWTAVQNAGQQIAELTVTLQVEMQKLLDEANRLIR